MYIPSGFHIDDPAAPLSMAVISYWGITDADGAASGLTLVCGNLANVPSLDGQAVKILTGPASPQTRPIQVHAGGTLTFGAPFTNAAGAVQQITSGTLFVVLSAPGGSPGPGPAPAESLSYYGVVDAVPGANQFTIAGLAGLGAGKFSGTNPYQAFILRDAGGASAAPQGEMQAITAYVTGTGAFTTAAFTAAVAVGDEVLIIHPALAAALLAPAIIASGTLDTSSDTVPADSTRTEANNHFRGHLFMPTAGAMQWRASRIVQYTAVGGIFTVDPNNPFPAATGLVTYVVIRDQSEFVPAADAAINRTPADVIGNKSDTPTYNANDASVIFSLMRYLRGVHRGTFFWGEGAAQAGSTASQIVDNVLIIPGVPSPVGHRVLMLDGANMGQQRTIVDWDTVANTLDVSPAFEAVVGVADRYVILESSYENPLAIQNVTDNLKPSDVIGNKTDAATLDDMSALATASLVAEVKRILLRMSSDAFTATIMGAARTELDTMLAQLAVYFKAAGAAFNPTIFGAVQADVSDALQNLAVYFKAAAAAYSATVGGVARADVEASFTAIAAYFNAASAALAVVSQPGVAARSNVNDILTDLADLIAGAGITNFPAAAAAANGISLAEVIRYIQETVLGYEGATALANKLTAARAALLDQITAGRMAELDAANIPADVDGLKTSRDRQLFQMDFWSVPQEEVSIPAVAGTLSLPDVTVADLPAGATIVRAIAMVKFRMIENTNGGANKLNGATVAATSQVVQVRDDTPGTWRDAINFVDDQFGIAASTREGGDVLLGSIDIAVEVDGNDTYNFQYLLARADLAALNWNDVQSGLRIWYSV